MSAQKKHLGLNTKHANLALLVGVLSLLVSAYGMWGGLSDGDSRPIISWLIGFGFWLSLAVGGLFLVMLWYVFGAGWPIIIRRQLEHVLSIFPWLAAFFFPLILIGWFYDANPGILWTWMNPDAILPGGQTVAEDVLYQSKAVYLNIPFFTLRCGLIFGLWIYLSYVFRSNSFEMDGKPSPKWVIKPTIAASIGIPLVAIATTLAAIDWFKSLDYHWFSTMYGVWFFANSMRVGLAGAVVICFLLTTRGYLKGIYNQAHQYDLGCLCLAFTVFWAYISFCQYFLIYNANIPEETFWYNIRQLDTADVVRNHWYYVGVYGLMIGAFLIPFLFLLWYKTKIVHRRLFAVCCWILFFQILDLYFNILPGKIPADNVVGYVIRPFDVSIFDISALLGIGGVCVWAFIRSALSKSPIPIHDPFIENSVHHHE